MRIWPTKRTWKRLTIGLAALLAVALIVNGVLAWRAEWRLRTRLDAIRASGAPASIADLAPEPIPDKENAAAYLKRIEPRLAEFSKEYGRFYSTPLGEKLERAEDRGEPATPEQIEAIRAILDRYPDVEAAIAEAAQCDQYASRLDFSVAASEFIDAAVKLQGTVRTAARFLNWRADVLLAEGQHEKAVKRGIQMYRLARHYEKEPTLVSYLVAIAVQSVGAGPLYDALSAGPVSPKLHATLEEELARHDDPQRLQHALTAERALSASFPVNPYRQHPLWVRTFGWMLKSHQVGVIDYLEENMRLAEKPWHEVRAQFGTVDSSPPPSEHGAMADLLAPAVRAWFQAEARSLAVSRALRIYNALRQFAAKNGREANGLEELDLPAQATIDPYTGEPLKLKHTDQGWMIYSVMENGTDDGGDFKKQNDYGVGPPKRRLTE